MNDDQRVRSVAALVAAARHFHTQGAIASIIGKSQGHVSRLIAGETEIDAVDAVTLDQRSHGKIPRHELRPDLWEKPELPRSTMVHDIATGRMRDGRKGLKYWESALSAMPLKTGDTVKVTTEFVDGDYRVVNVRPRAMHRKINERAADAGGGAAASTPRERTQDGATRTGKFKGKERQKETRTGRAAAKGRQGRKAESRKGKGRG